MAQINFPSLYILRPSLLLGERSEKRPGEKIAQQLSRVFMPLLVGPLKKIRPVKASAVAKKMRELVIDKKSSNIGLKIISNVEI